MMVLLQAPVCKLSNHFRLPAEGLWVFLRAVIQSTPLESLLKHSCPASLLFLFFVFCN
jgi:hypothetical protein